jgi:hypothetical protein
MTIGVGVGHQAGRVGDALLAARPRSPASYQHRGVVMDVAVRQPKMRRDVEDEGDVYHPGPGGQVSELAKPQPSGPAGVKAPIDQVMGRSAAGFGIVGRAGGRARRP